jgi:hypothetical protein
VTSTEEHGHGAHRERQRREDAPATAQLDDGGLHHGVVAFADPPDELPGMSPKTRRTRPRRHPVPRTLAGATSWPAPPGTAGVPFTWSSAMAAWPVRSSRQNPRGVSYRASGLREGGANGSSGDAAGRDGSSLLVHPVTWRHAPSKAPDRVSRPHPSRVCVRAGRGQKLRQTGNNLTGAITALLLHRLGRPKPNETVGVRSHHRQRWGHAEPCAAGRMWIVLRPCFHGFPAMRA